MTKKPKTGRDNIEELFHRTLDTRCRDTKGRFATPEKAYADRISKENRFLRLECERYKRSYFSAVDLSSHWQRKYVELLGKVKALCK